MQHVLQELLLVQHATILVLKAKLNAGSNTAGQTAGGGTGGKAAAGGTNNASQGNRSITINAQNAQCISGISIGGSCNNTSAQSNTKRWK